MLQPLVHGLLQELLQRGGSAQGHSLERVGRGM